MKTKTKVKMKVKTVIGSALLILGAGCQSLNQDLAQINTGLARVRGVSPPPTSATIKTRWRVSHVQAVAWLRHDTLTWDDNGRLHGVNWYDFWKQQCQAKTSLAREGERLCKNDHIAGGNCQTYWQAYSMSKANESHYWGKQMEREI